jgi:dihydroxyacetone kinase-like predicted kinase
VVDAGGAGLARVFEGALRYLVDAAPARPESRTGPRPSTLVAHADDGFGYETMFLLQPRPGASLDVDAIRMALDAIGDSVLVAGDARAVKVHVHSERPDDVLRYGAEQGSLSRISVENLDSQARDVRERRAAEFAGPEANGVAREPRATATAGATVTSDPTGDPGRPPGATSAPVPLAVIAVAAGDGLAAVFASFGCTKIVGGGQGANPSTGELLAAVEEVNADHVLLLPNNPNVLLAARQVVDLSPRAVTVVPTRNAPEGVAALLALDPVMAPGLNAEAMAGAARSIQSLQVTRAVRNATIGGRRVKKGQVIVLDPDDGLVAADNDEVRAVIAAVDALSPGFELLTIYYGDGADLASAEGLARRVGEHHPEIEVEIVRGGQPHYHYLVAAE